MSDPEPETVPGAAAALANARRVVLVDCGLGFGFLLALGASAAMGWISDVRGGLSYGYTSGFLVLGSALLAGGGLWLRRGLRERSRRVVDGLDVAACGGFCFVLAAVFDFVPLIRGWGWPSVIEVVGAGAITLPPFVLNVIVRLVHGRTYHAIVADAEAVRVAPPDDTPP